MTSTFPNHKFFSSTVLCRLSWAWVQQNITQVGSFVLKKVQSVVPLPRMSGEFSLALVIAPFPLLTDRTHACADCQDHGTRTSISLVVLSEGGDVFINHQQRSRVIAPFSSEFRLNKTVMRIFRRANDKGMVGHTQSWIFSTNRLAHSSK